MYVYIHFKVEKQKIKYVYLKHYIYQIYNLTELKCRFFFSSLHFKNFNKKIFFIIHF